MAKRSTPGHHLTFRQQAQDQMRMAVDGQLDDIAAGMKLNAHKCTSSRR
jgi:hypothetical protein